MLAIIQQTFLNMHNLKKKALLAFNFGPGFMNKYPFWVQHLPTWLPLGWKLIGHYDLGSGVLIRLCLQGHLWPEGGKSLGLG